MEKPMICAKCNGFFRVRSVRYEPSPPVDKLVRCPYCSKQNEVMWPMGATIEIIAEDSASKAASAG